MIPKKKLYSNYFAWGLMFAVVGVLYGINFRLGLYFNVFLALFAASIAVRSFIFGASLAVVNMAAAVITLLINCSLNNNQSCNSNPFILGSFTPLLSFALWLVLFGCAKFTKTVRSRYARPTHHEDK
jgi:hypothetical protein